MILLFVPRISPQLRQWSRVIKSLVGVFWYIQLRHVWFKSSFLYNRIIEVEYKDNGPESSKALSFNCRLLIYSIETWFKSSFLYNRIIEIKYKDNDPNHHFSRMFDEWWGIHKWLSIWVIHIYTYLLLIQTI